jgi:hypothetical protein
MKKLLLAAMMCVASASSLAGLGAAPDLPITNDTSGSFTGLSYTRRDSVLETGTQVSEYIDRSGNVFAVSWHGPVMPNLRMLLGTYFTTYTSEAEKQADIGVSQFSVERPDFAMQSGGRMGAFQGRAWLPSQLPAGIDISAIN